MNGLEVRGLSKEFGGFRLEADFQIAAGERAGLAARSGSGKTTLLRILAGLEPLHKGRDQGRILLDGQDITQLTPERRRIGFVFQDAALFPSMSVLENAAYGLMIGGVSRKDRERLALEWLERVGLRNRSRAQVLDLSGGEKQRVAWIRALIWKPRLLLLDEPFSALDAELRQVLRTELISMHQLCPVPMLLVTHDQQDLSTVAQVRLAYEESSDAQVRRFFRSADFDR